MVSLGTTGRTTPKARERVSQEEGETYNETKKKQTKQQVHTREAKTSQEACLIGVTQTTYSGNTRGGLGMLRGFCPPWGPTPRPAAPPGPGPAPPPETPTGRFRQDSTPKEVQRGWGGKQRKSPPRKHCFFFPPLFFGKSCPNSSPKSQALGRGHHDHSRLHWPFTSTKGSNGSTHGCSPQRPCDRG